MNTVEAYFRPLGNLLQCYKYRDLKPLDIAIIATYATIIVPIGFYVFAVLNHLTWRPIPSEGNYTYFAQKILANGGNAQAQYKLGDFYFYGPIGNFYFYKPDVASKVKAIEYFKKAAAQNHKNACHELGYIYLSLLKKEDEPLRQALGDDVSEKSKYYFNQYILQADEGNKAKSLQALGEIAEIEDDYDTALKFHEQAIKLSLYSIDHSKKFVIKHHKEKAKECHSKNEPEKYFEYLSKAADLDDLDARHEVAMCYAQGYGVQADFRQTIRVLHILTKCKHEPSIKKIKFYKDEYKKLADAGNANAMCNLGFILDVEADYYNSKAEAIELYKKAAEMGSKAAQWNLGLIYSKLYFEYRVKEDIETAKMWFKKSADNGYAPAIKSLQELEGKND